MIHSTPQPVRRASAAERVRRRVAAGGERVWRHADFRDLPPAAVAQALSRLARAGALVRLGKGLYYRPRRTALGTSAPNPALLPAPHRKVFPTGVAGANLLGFSTQAAARLEVATDGPSLPRLLVGADTVVHTRRPAAWRALTATEAALLDFLRVRGTTSELPPARTARRLLALLAEERRFERVLRVAGTEPPRVQAMLGALGRELGKPPAALRTLRAGLNPLSRFDFGPLSVLKYATEWQAKGPRPRATV